MIIVDEERPPKTRTIDHVLTDIIGSYVDPETRVKMAMISDLHQKWLAQQIADDVVSKAKRDMERREEERREEGEDN